MVNQRLKLKRHQLSLQKALIAAFILQVVAAVGAVGYISFRGGQLAVRGLSYQLRSEVTARIERELRTYFETPHELNRLNAAAFGRGDLDLTNGQYGEGQLYQQMKIAPTVAFVYCGSANRGEFFGVLRSPDNEALQLSYGNSGNNFLRQFYNLDVNGDRTFLIRQLDTPYDARQRPWFKAATSRQGPAWTDIYIAFTTGLPNITASLPVYDKSGRQLLGVCGTDVVLPEEFRTFLRNLDIGKTGQAFVIDRSGTLISNSTDEPLMQGEGDTATSLQATESQDRLVRGTAQYLQSQFGGFEGIKTTQRVDFQLNGQRQFLEVVPFRDGFGLDWLIVVTVPEADFMGQIYANTRNTVLFALVALGVAIGGGVLVARWITKPVVDLTIASEAMADGHLNQTVTTEGLHELDRLAGAFNTMAFNLKQSFNDLQQSETRFKSLVTNLPGAVYRCHIDQQWTMVFLSEIIAEITGYPATDFLNNTTRTFASIIHTDDVAKVDQTINHAIAHKQPYITDYRIHHKDGSIRWITERGRSTFDKDDNCSYIEGVIFDTTASHEAAAQLRREKLLSDNIIRSLPGIFYLYDQNAQLVRWNKRYEEVLEYSPDEMVGLSALDTVVERDRDMLAQRIEEIFTSGESSAETFLLSKTGSEIPYYVTGRVIPIEGKPHFAGAGLDLTARLLNEELKAENLRLGTELNIARQIQKMILPTPAELTLKGLDVAGFMEPADEVGGDYYDVLELDGIVTIGIGDVTGHGLESGILMLMTQTAVRTLKESREPNPVKFLDTLNRTLYGNVQRMNTDKNLTLAILNYFQGRLSISGQHEEILVVRVDGSVEPIDTMDLGLPIGLDDDIADFIDHVTVELQ
ncbi:MAG: PAS domain-containing protein, partial [Cyanobacteria bacterium P01_H01_bin.58]